MAIIPIPNTRVSNLLLRQRLTQQYQNDQLDLFRLQEQISTGQRISLPSEDAPAALRAIALQRLIERKSQLETNIKGGQSFLSATDTAIADVATQLADLKGATLGVAGTIATQQDRDAVISQVDRFLESLVGIANRQFRGRYLFAGSQTSQQPYSLSGESVAYAGDDNSINNYSDLGVLFATNATGQAVFGGISEPVIGTTDLNPQLNSETRLSSLRGGRGISSGGALSISDGNNISIIDISGARTIGDLVRLIEENPPPTRTVDVQVTGNGLTISLDSGSININEVGNGTSARELGILGVTGVGTDLDPILLKTTSLDNLLGTKARALIESGANNDNADILIEASNNGGAFDGVTVQFVDDSLLRANSGLTAGNEVVEYEATAQPAEAALTFSGVGNDLILRSTVPGIGDNNIQINITNGGAIGDVANVSFSSPTVLNIAIDSGGLTSVGAIDLAVQAASNFEVVADPSAGDSFSLTSTIDAGDIGATGNTGNSGGAPKTLYIRIDPNNSNANQVVSAINTEGTFSANLDPADTSTFSQAGTGKVVLNSTALTSGGSGAALDQNSGIRVVNGGQTYDITFEDAETVEDLLNILNSSKAGLYAEINSKANGINVRSRLSGQDFQIGEINGGSTATQLGIRTYTDDTKLKDFNYGVGVPTSGGFDLPTADGDDLIINTRDNSEFSVDLSDAKSITDVVDAINAASGGTVLATEILAGNNTIVRLVDQTSGLSTDEFTLTLAPDSLAGQYLGLIPNGDTQVATTGDTFTGDELRYTDFTITVNGNQTFSIDVSEAKTVGDVLTAITTGTGGLVTAQLASSGNGIELVGGTGVGTLSVASSEGSQAAESLGLIQKGETENSSTTNTLIGTDQNFLETDSVFNTLIRLRDALESGDINAIERAIAKVESDIDRVTFSRAEVGARWQGLINSEYTLLEEEIQLRSALSDEIDVDLLEAISQLTARQISLEASLRSTANILQLSLLNFI